MLRMTLDTGCIIDAAQKQDYWREIERLAELARRGTVQLYLTTGFDVDQIRATPENRSRNLEWLHTLPINRTPGPFRFDMSTFDGPDGFATEEAAAVDEKIKSILRPSFVQGTAFPERKINDVHHLTAHHIAGHDYFVTKDADDMINRRDELERQVGIKVINPIEALALVEQADSQ